MGGRSCDIVAQIQDSARIASARSAPRAPLDCCTCNTTVDVYIHITVNGKCNDSESYVWPPFVAFVSTGIAYPWLMGILHICVVADLAPLILRGS